VFRVGHVRKDTAGEGAGVFLNHFPAVLE
jgi:hypothetical protein